MNQELRERFEERHAEFRKRIEKLKRLAKFYRNEEKNQRKHHPDVAKCYKVMLASIGAELNQEQKFYRDSMKRRRHLQVLESKIAKLAGRMSQRRDSLQIPR